VVFPQEMRGGRTILHLAIDFGSKEVLRALLDERSGIEGLDLNALTYSGLTPYQLATDSDKWVSQRLSERGASVEPFPDDSSDESLDEDDEDEEMVGYHLVRLKFLKWVSYCGLTVM